MQWPIKSRAFYRFCFLQHFFKAKLWCLGEWQTKSFLIYHIKTWNNGFLATYCFSTWACRHRTKTPPSLWGGSDLELSCWGSSLPCCESNVKWQHFPKKQRHLFFFNFSVADQRMNQIPYTSWLLFPLF